MFHRGKRRQRRSPIAPFRQSRSLPGVNQISELPRDPALGRSFVADYIKLTADLGQLVKSPAVQVHRRRLRQMTGSDERLTGGRD